MNVNSLPSVCLYAPLIRLRRVALYKFVLTDWWGRFACQPVCLCAGEDPRFWFGRDTGMKSGGRKSPSGVQGQSPGGVWGRSHQKPEECYVIWDWKNHLGLWREKTSPYRLILHDNIVISSTHRIVSSHFCVKIQNAVCGLQSQQNGPQWQPECIVAMDLQKDARLQPILGYRCSDSR